MNIGREKLPKFTMKSQRAVKYGERTICIYIYGHTGDTQYVLYGDDALAVTAEPLKGYEFVEWSDGVKTATRHDVNITDDLHIYAVFRPVGA